MTTGTLKTQGTELFTVDALSSSVAAVLKFACPTGITGLGGAADQLEDTCLDNTTDKTYKPGLGHPRPGLDLLEDNHPLDQVVGLRGLALAVHQRLTGPFTIAPIVGAGPRRTSRDVDVEG